MGLLSRAGVGSGGRAGSGGGTSGGRRRAGGIARRHDSSGGDVGDGDTSRGAETKKSGGELWCWALAMRACE